MIGRKMKYAGGLVLAAIALGWVADAEAANLDKSLLKDAGPIMDALAEKGIKTVGVLPFRVKKGTRPAGFNAAPLATGLPGRIENAMIVSQSSTQLKAMNVIRDAASTATKAKVGSWMTSRAEFNKLFTTDYDLAWGTSKKKPDGFLIGEVVSTPEDRYHTKVLVQLITAKSWDSGKLTPVKIHEIKIDTDRSLLRDMGYAYALPRALTKKKGMAARDLDNEAVEQVDKEEKGQKQDRPQTPQEKKQSSHTPEDVAGFKVEVEYDGVKQEIKAKEGGSQAKQPEYKLDAARAGQKVVIYVTRTAPEDVKLGAVIKVNGKSVFESEDTESIGCKKWIYDLSAKGARWDFAGYYKKGEGGKLTVNEFKVLTKEDSDAKVSELGSRAGWIDIDIFASGGGGGGGAQQEEELLISTRGAVKERGKTLKEVQDKIAKANNLKLVKSRFTPRSGGLMFMDTESREADPYKSDELPNPKRVGGVSIQYYENTPGKVVD